MTTTFTTEEKEHYNSQAQSNLSSKHDAEELFKAYETQWQSNLFKNAYGEWLSQVDLAMNKVEMDVLDYCSGQCFHGIAVQKRYPKIKMEGFDISDVSIEVGNKLSAILPEGNKPSYQVMDAHHLAYNDASFDLVINFGSLSSLDLEKAISEVYRVLKPEGHFVCIETFGHNPFANLKRKLNVLLGRRTSWAGENILNREKLKTIQEKFEITTIKHFGFFSLFLPIKKPVLINLMDKVDRVFFALFPFMKRFAFKIVFTCKKPKDS